MPDRTTMQFYADHAAEYVRGNRDSRRPRLDAFLDRLPPGGAVLELGTGGGHDAARMLARGFAVTPSDASPELAKQAEALLGRGVRMIAFHELEDVAAYDGIWASAALLHAPRSELTDDLARIWRALRPGGHFAASFKSGNGEGRDELGRYYNYLGSDELDAHMRAAAEWAELRIEAAAGFSYGGRETPWLWVTARRPA